MLRYPRYRRLPVLAYSFGYALVFAAKLNYLHGTTVVFGTQSYSRYTLTLFPLTIFIADRLRHFPGGYASSPSAHCSCCWRSTAGCTPWVSGQPEVHHSAGSSTS